MAGQSVLDQAIGVAQETTYATYVAPARGYECTSDEWRQDSEQLEQNALRAEKHAQLGSRRQIIHLGGTGQLNGAVTTANMGLILSNLLGTSTAPAETESGSGVYKSSFATNTVGPTDSYTVQVARSNSDQTLVGFNYLGSVPTGWNFALAAGGILTYSVDYTCSVVEQGAVVSPTYAAANDMYVDDNVEIKINDAQAANITGFDFTGDLGFAVDRRFIRNSSARAKPIRSGQPTFSGSLDGEFKDSTIFDLYQSGDDFKLEIIAKSKKVLGQTGTGGAAVDEFAEVAFTMPACRFDDANPTASPDELTSQGADFFVVWDETNPAISINLTSGDDAH